MRRRRNMPRYIDMTRLDRRYENADGGRGAGIGLSAMSRSSILELLSSIVHPLSSPLFHVFCVLLLTALGVRAQSGDKELLPDRLGQRWRAVNPARVLDGQRLSGLPDADVLGEYGLR